MLQSFFLRGGTAGNVESRRTFVQKGISFCENEAVSGCHNSLSSRTFVMKCVVCTEIAPAYAAIP